jgi:Protein of unknown function (DUF5661)
MHALVSVSPHTIRRAGSKYHGAWKAQAVWRGSSWRGTLIAPDHGQEHHVTDHQDTFAPDDAREIGESIGIDWATSPFDVEQFRAGLHVELEHGRRDPETNVTDDDRIVTGKIARAHLNEFPDYYTRLAQMEAEAERYWRSR